ncbi:hypothetical protein Pint_02106 [Pistacia integerrima]|uniref:Uncharacterized protein n=1 Tax=Pistacia integerrima TaxID=434235 RepID=A0ACC0ZIA4_9ROSI|nr:hypothetical protein Pint_02106 [Pistacia integerrima]
MALVHISSLPLTNSPRYHLIKRPQNNAPVNLQLKCSMSRQVPHSPHPRKSANYQPTIWSYNFLQSLRIDELDEESGNRGKNLEEEVRCKVNNEKTELLSILELIDDIQRLGLGYRFHKDIKKALNRINLSWKKYEDKVKAENKLHATALRFRLLRQHGYHISQDVFKTFVDQKGNYMANLHKDIKGMLSLYEASYLAFEEEKLLEEAQTFSTTHLTDLQRNVDPAISQLVTHALELPLHHRMQRLEARWYIEVYSERNDPNYLLLELAQLDFNRVQSVYQKDVKDMSRWWKEIDLANKLDFARDRLMECFFWTVGMVPDPQFSNCRKGLTKVTTFITIIDDIYDVYGSLDELELFTDVLERFALYKNSSINKTFSSDSLST